MTLNLSHRRRDDESAGCGPGPERDVPPPDELEPDGVDERRDRPTERSTSSAGSRDNDASPRHAGAPFNWTRVVKPSDAPSLTPAHKLVWLEHYCWEKAGRGCMVSASALGKRLGLSQRTVERIRQDLLRWGLLRKHDRGNGRTAIWRPELPARCRPQGTKLADDDAFTYAEMLAEHIAARVKPPMPVTVVPPTWMTEVDGVDDDET